MTELPQTYRIEANKNEITIAVIGKVTAEELWNLLEKMEANDPDVEFIPTYNVAKEDEVDVTVALRFPIHQRNKLKI